MGMRRWIEPTTKVPLDRKELRLPSDGHSALCGMWYNE